LIAVVAGARLQILKEKLPLRTEPSLHFRWLVLCAAGERVLAHQGTIGEGFERSPLRVGGEPSASD